MFRRFSIQYLNLNYKNVKYSNIFNKYSTESIDQENDKSVKKDDQNKPNEKKLETIKKPILTRLIFAEEKKSNKEKNDGEQRKGPFKNYFESEERDKKQIMFYEEYFETTARKKDLDNFMVRFLYINGLFFCNKKSKNLIIKGCC